MQAINKLIFNLSNIECYDNNTTQNQPDKPYPLLRVLRIWHSAAKQRKIDYFNSNEFELIKGAKLKVSHGGI